MKSINLSHIFETYLSAIELLYLIEYLINFNQNIMSKKKNKKLKVNPALEGLDVHVNEFGEIITSFEADKINEFLDKKLYDKKIGNQDAETGSLKEKHKNQDGK